MSTLADISAGKSVKILKMNATDELKQRLQSFGVRKDSIVKVKNLSIAKSTMEIEVGTTKLAMRIEEAKELEVGEL